jgi:hypothetical protein
LVAIAALITLKDLNGFVVFQIISNGEDSLALLVAGRKIDGYIFWPAVQEKVQGRIVLVEGC